MWNKAAERITGFTAEEVLGRKCSDNVLNHVDKTGTKLCLVGCPLHASMNDESPREAELFLHHKDGHRVPVLVRTAPYFDASGICTGGLELFSDISSIVQHEERLKELEKLAMIDSLTEVANRYYLTQQLEASFEENRRYGMSFGLLFFDIDHFKDFNDTYGHETGDVVLKLVSRTVSRNLRPFDLFGRWGGEEFIAIIRNIEPSELVALADRFRVLIENSYVHVNGKDVDVDVDVTVSIGATMFSAGDTPGSMRERADKLMYKSKEAGRNRVTIG